VLASDGACSATYHPSSYPTSTFSDQERGTAGAQRPKLVRRSQELGRRRGASGVAALRGGRRKAGEVPPGVAGCACHSRGSVPVEPWRSSKRAMATSARRDAFSDSDRARSPRRRRRLRCGAGRRYYGERLVGKFPRARQHLRSTEGGLRKSQDRDMSLQSDRY